MRLTKAKRRRRGEWCKCRSRRSYYDTPHFQRKLVDKQYWEGLLNYGVHALHGMRILVDVHIKGIDVYTVPAEPPPGENFLSSYVPYANTPRTLPAGTPYTVGSPAVLVVGLKGAPLLHRALQAGARA